MVMKNKENYLGNTIEKFKEKKDENVNETKKVVQV
jgi:hypothetical protein